MILSLSDHAQKTPLEGRFSFFEFLSYGVGAALLLLSWLNPLHFLPWVSWHSEILSFAAALWLASCGLLTAVKKDRSGDVFLPIPVFPLFALGLIAAIQGAAGLMVFWGDVFVLELYLALCIVCLIFGFVAFSRQALDSESGAHYENNKKTALICLAFTLVLGAFASAVLAFVQVFELWEHVGWISRLSKLHRPGANLGQPNHLATLLLMGVASVLFLYESRKLKATSSALIFLILSLALATTESRTGVVSFLVLLTWWFLKRTRVEFRLPVKGATFAALVLLVFFWEWPSLLAFILQSSSAAEIDFQAGLRAIVWPQMLEAMGQKPWLGWGMNQIPKAHNAVVHAYATSAPFSYGHNILFDLALGCGIPLTILLVLMAGVWLWRRARSANQLMPWYCLSLALPLAVHSMLEYPFAYSYFLVPVMFAIGALEGMVGGKPVLRLGVRPAAMLLLGGGILATWSAVEYVSIEEDFRVARFEALHIGQMPSNHQAPAVVMLTQLGALLDNTRITPRPGMSAGELELAQKVALRYPWTATQNRYALSLALNGQPEEAVRQMHVMRAMRGEKVYGEIKAGWLDLAQNKYAQLRELTLP